MVKEEYYRFEKKFVVPEAQARWAIGMLKNWMLTDRCAGADGSYKVRSLYFDDAEKSAYYDKEDGALMKKKYRARIYFKENGAEASAVKMECKKRNGDKTVKSVAAISREDFSGLLIGKPGIMSGLLPSMPGDPLMDEGVLADFRRDASNKKLYPAIVVDYERTALDDRCNGFRITFDKNVRAGTDLSNFFDSRMMTVPVPDIDGIILELKYSLAMPEHILKVLAGMDVRQQSVSKYYSCMNNGYRQI